MSTVEIQLLCLSRAIFAPYIFTAAIRKSIGQQFASEGAPVISAASALHRLQFPFPAEH
jgi:hypothetical protein